MPSCVFAHIGSHLCLSPSSGQNWFCSRTQNWVVLKWKLLLYVLLYWPCLPNRKISVSEPNYSSNYSTSGTASISTRQEMCHLKEKLCSKTLMVAIEVSHRSSKRGTCHPGNMWNNYLTASHLVNQENQLPREPQDSKLIILINRAHCNYFPSIPLGVCHQLVATLEKLDLPPNVFCAASAPGAPCCVSDVWQWKVAALRLEMCDIHNAAVPLRAYSGLIVAGRGGGWDGRWLADLGPQRSKELQPFVSELGGRFVLRLQPKRFPSLIRPFCPVLSISTCPCKSRCSFLSRVKKKNTTWILRRR